MSGLVRRVVSVAGLVLLLLLALGYRLLPAQSPTLPATEQATADPPVFHRFDRATVAGLDDESGPCLVCHPAAAHYRSERTRAFLNLHRRSLDCGVCHLSGRGIAPRHFRGDTVVSTDTLAAAPYGKVYAARRTGDGWQKVTAPDETLTLRLQGPACRTCHRRGSPLLATDGLVDPYRRRVLEDLSVLRFLGRSR